MSKKKTKSKQKKICLYVLIMFTSTKKPLQVRMGKEKGQSIVGFTLHVNESHFEMSRQVLN